MYEHTELLTCQITLRLIIETVPQLGKMSGIMSEVNRNIENDHHAFCASLIALVYTRFT